MINLDAVNRMDAVAFRETFGDVAEHSPWVAERAFGEKPFASREALVAAFAAAMAAAAQSEQLTLIRAHPDLAGKAARAGTMAHASRQEQAGAGLGALSEADYARFTRLNAAYGEKFGFPFIFAVKGATKDMILDAFEERLTNDTATEFETALTQIARIFRFRLEALVED